jgi:hypothetical protein
MCISGWPAGPTAADLSRQLQGPADQAEVDAADHVLAIAGELVERAVAQPDLPRDQLGLEADVV